MELFKRFFPELPIPEIPKEVPKPTEVPKPVEIPKPKEEEFLEPGTTIFYEVGENIIFNYTKSIGNVSYYIARSNSNNYNIVLIKDGQFLIPNLSFSELEPDSSRVPWYMAKYDYTYGSYVFGLFDLSWINNFMLKIIPNETITFYVKYRITKMDKVV